MDIKSTIKGISAGVLLLFGTSVVTFEGLPSMNPNGNYSPYKDPVGITTLCYGYVPQMTEAIQKEYTKKECDVLLDKTLYKYTIVLSNLPVMPVSTTVGFLDFAYNAGINAANNSTVKKRLAEGNYVQASKAVLQWRYVSKKKPDYSKGRWEHRNGKYYYDCSQYRHGKPNKLCYGLYTRRLMESELLAGTMTDKEEIQSYIHRFGR